MTPPHVEDWGTCPICWKPVLDSQSRSQITPGVWVHLKPCWLKAVALERARLKYPKRNNGSRPPDGAS